MTTRLTKGDATRARILEAAVELLSREGPDGFTASALAAEAGVSKGTLFHHFDALDEIPLYALEEVFLTGMERVEHEGHSLEGYLRVLFREMRVLVDDKRFLRGYFVFLLKGIFDPRLGRRLADSGLEMHRTLAASLGPHLPAGADADVTARLVEVVLDGIALHELLVGDHDTLVAAWQLFLSGLTRGTEGAQPS